MTPDHPVPGPPAAPGAPQDAEGSPSTPEPQIAPQSLVERRKVWADAVYQDNRSDRTVDRLIALADSEQATLRADLAEWKRVASEIEDDRERCARGWDAAEDELARCVAGRDTAKARCDKAEAALAELSRALHTLHARTFDSAGDETWERNPRCSACQSSWPCPTLALLPSDDTLDPHALLLEQDAIRAERWSASGFSPSSLASEAGQADGDESRG